MLLVCGKQSGTLTPQMLSAVFAQLITAARMEPDASFLASLFRCLADCVLVAGGGSSGGASSSVELGAKPADALPQDLRDGILDSVRYQLQGLADKRKGRARRLGLSRDTSRSRSRSRSLSGSPERNRSNADDLEEEREDMALME